MNQTERMGREHVGRLIFSMSAPAMISMLINALYNIVDSIFVGRYSTDAFTAVSLVFPLQQLVIAVAVGTAVGVNSLIARRLGARMRGEAEDAARHGIVLAVLSGLVFMVIGFGLSRAFLSAFTTNPTVLEQAISYSHIAVGLSFFVMISIMCEKIQQATGNMIIPMIQGLTGTIINIVLDPIMIFGLLGCPELGVRGAAIATIIGQIGGMLVGIYAVFFHQKALNCSMRRLKLSIRTFLEIYQVGLPGIIMQSVVSVMTSGLNMILISYSEIAVSVLGLYFKLQTFVFMPVFGLNQGALPVMGYNYGAGDRKRLMSAYRVTVAAAFAIMVAGLIVFQTIPDKMEKILEDKGRIQWFASKYANAHDVFFIGRGIDYAVGLEGSLKLKEISYVHSEAYAAGELKHGTISLIEDGTLVIGILTQNALYEKTISNMVECKSRGAYLMGLTTYGKYETEDHVDFTVYVPKVDEHFVGSLAVIPLQLMGYYVSVAKGLDVDKPRNLAKSVTVE